MKKILTFLLAALMAFQVLNAATAVWAKTPGQSEPDAPVADSNPTDPSEPEEPTDPIVPTEPEEPLDPTDPSEPEEPSDPTDPSEPEERPDELHSAYLFGSSDGAFYPEKSLSRAEMAKIFYNLGGYPEGNARFPDVSDKMWYATAINALAAADVLHGYPDGSFHPEDFVTRAEMVKVLENLSGETATRNQTFTDVSVGFWANSAISLAQEKGWVNGYGDGSFRPNQNISRAEAVVMLNRYLGRVPDRAAIDRGEGLRFFPDVHPGQWYYYHLMEATTFHTAHWDSPEAEECWLDPYCTETALKDGFYSFGKQIFVVRDGSFVRSPGAGSYNGVSYFCLASSGICKVFTEVLELYSGKLTLLSGGLPMADCNQYPDGFYLKAGQLYVAQKGEILRKKTSVMIDGISFACSGPSGVCSVSDWTKLKLPQSNLSVFSQQLTSETAQSGSGAVTLAQALRAAVKVYEAYFCVEYPLSNSDSDAQFISRGLDYGILSQEKANYSTPVQRGELAAILCRCLHGRELEAVNQIELIPDMTPTQAEYSSVLGLYRAGVMSGVDAQHNAVPNGTVSKTEFASLLKRLENRASRVKFTLKKKRIEAIEYGRSGSGNYPLTAYRYGDGKNVMVLTFALHGWEDNFAYDGKELVYLADEVRGWLEQNYELLTKGDWSVYVLRCVNPDGVYLGTTCNGKGRCTTTRLDANGKLLTDRGIDMNRCFPYNYRCYTDARNYNGTAPLQCKEAQALADFVKKVKGSGKNICIDTHGWLSQVITSSGKGALANAFLKQFPNNNYTYMAKGYGYFTAWTGFDLGYDSCLLELPASVTSHQKFLDSGSVWRYENAIKELLQSYSSAKATQPVTPEEIARLERFDD